MTVSASKPTTKPEQDAPRAELDEAWKEMDEAKQQYASFWATARKLTEAKLETEQDGTPKAITVPICREHIESGMAEEFAKTPIYNLLPLDEDSRRKIDLLKKTDEHYEYIDNFFDKLVSHGYIKKELGVSVMFDGYYETVEKVTYYDKYGDKDIREEVRRNFTSRVVDPRFFWTDNVSRIEYAEKCIEHEYISIEEVNRRYKDHPLYDQVVVNETKGEYKKSKTDQGSKYFYDDSDETAQKLVKVEHYYQIPDSKGDGDQYSVWLNERLVRDGANWHPLKRLPYAVQADLRDPRSLWGGRGVPKQLEQHQVAYNRILDIYIKQSANASTPQRLLGEDAVIENSDQIGKIGAHLNITGSLDNVRDLISPPPSQSAIQSLELIKADAVRVDGNDPDSLAQMNPSEAATKAAIREESKKRRTALRDREFTNFFKRMKESRLACLMAFLPQPLIEGVVQGTEDYKEKLASNKKFEYPKIYMKGRIEIDREDPEDEESKPIGATFEESEDFTEIEIHPAVIRGNFTVKVEEGTNRPVYKALENAIYQENLQTYLLLDDRRAMFQQQQQQEKVDETTELINNFAELTDFVIPEGLTNDPVQEGEEFIKEMLTPEPKISKNNAAIQTAIGGTGLPQQGGTEITPPSGEDLVIPEAPTPTGIGGA